MSRATDASSARYAGQAAQAAKKPKVSKSNAASTARYARQAKAVGRSQMSDAQMAETKAQDAVALKFLSAIKWQPGDAVDVSNLQPAIDRALARRQDEALINHGMSNRTRRYADNAADEEIRNGTNRLRSRYQPQPQRPGLRQYSDDYFTVDPEPGESAERGSGVVPGFGSNRPETSTVRLPNTGDTPSMPDIDLPSWPSGDDNPPLRRYEDPGS